ncbi:MAG TPA: type II toxin-antitoxin system ParD family antitoxin [Chthonomonadaceae bacterium]|nr:type II toxin-antitoxin system ParD family antitoxin [Chthonomonadaceae bacterium]
MTVTLTPEMEQLITKQVQSGYYSSPGEVILQALQLLNEQEQLRAIRLEELRKEIAVGVAQADRGETSPLDIEEIKAEGRRVFAARSGQK